MSDGINVDLDALWQAHTDMMRTVQGLQQRLDQLQIELRPLVVTWTGQAAEAYQADQWQWHVAATDLGAALARLGGAVSDGHQAFRETESRNAGLF